MKSNQIINQIKHINICNFARTRKNKRDKHCNSTHLNLFAAILLLALAPNTVSALSSSDYPLFIGSVNRANVLLILDNSNSMDEEPTGASSCSAVDKCGSASDTSKSQIARDAANSLITTYANRINLGLMAYQQKDVKGNYYLHNSPYDVSYDKANDKPLFTGAREAKEKRFSYSNPSSPGNFIYYNIALPFYDTQNQGNAFCYTTSATAIPFSNAVLDTYRCFSSFTGTSDTLPVWKDAASEAAAGYSGSLVLESKLGPTDSDIAQGIYDFGKQLTWNYVGPTWFSNQSPGLGYLHIPISLLDDTQSSKLNKKLARSQFTDNKPTDTAYPLQNAGLTPIEGTLITAKNYFLGNLTKTDQGGDKDNPPKPPNSCGKNFVVMLTDGLPSTDKDGKEIKDPNTGLTAAATAASDLRSSSATVESYFIGFALPTGTDPETLKTLAVAGGTKVAYSATNLASLNTTFSQIFSDILDKTGSASSVATNSTNLKTESRVFQAKFASADWSGQLLQYKLNNLDDPEWDTGNKINAQTPDSRVIITKGASDGVPFRWSLTDLTATQQTYLNQDATGAADGLGSSRMTYLRGDASNEGTAANSFRIRSISKLGDIVNSNPWFVGPPSAGYSDVDYPGYNAFRNGALNRKPVVYVGGNDGMLHGVDASLDFTTVATGLPATDAGKEVLAYVPSKVFPSLSKLTSKDYNKAQNHRYFVDGSPMAADAYLGGTWYTTLIGALGAGGKGYYALDITNPSNFTEANAANILLWEFTDNDDADVGFTYNAPPAESNGQAKQIVKMANGKWAVILGNGYNSASGKAVLYILFIADGMDGTWSAGDFVKITADAPVAQNNGLSTPAVFDSDGDGYVDTIYAGDLQGNVWKFLVGPNTGDATVTSTPATWKLAFSAAGCTTNCTPLFSARDNGGTVQPITWPAEVTTHPDGGNMVLFGTGKYLESTDNASVSTQTFYGIHDAGATVSGRADLTPRTISTTTVGTTDFRTDTVGCGAFPLLACPVSSKGWYADLPTSGERVTGVPKLENSTILFNTFIPTAGACAEGGTGWLMAMDYLTGGLPDRRVFDTNSNLIINSDDTIISGVKIGGALGGTTLVRSQKPGEVDVAVSSLITGKLVSSVINLGGGSRGRISWRELIQ